MSVNLEIKGQLAKLLATEDLIVENKHVETAQFNVDTRVLTLPMWKKASNNVYDMLVGHEVGHALFTPNQDWDFSIPKQFLNVTEDARIEKLMKRKYAGLPKTFYRGYKELHDEDFFCLANEDINKMNLADRANLYFKIGGFLGIQFTKEEKDIIDLIANAETFNDAQEAARALYEYCKEEMQQKQKEDEVDIKIENQQSGSGSMTQDGDQLQEEVGEEEDDVNGEKSEDNETNDKGTQPSGASSELSGEQIEVKTDDMLNSNLKDLVDASSQVSEYIEIPKVNLETIINSNKDVHSYIDETFNQYLEDAKQYNEVDAMHAFDHVDSNYQQFKRSAQKEVNYLVKEFECRKAADSYSRSTVAKTGVLDCTKLHTYKYNEDLFKKVSIIPDGKNHGLIFILDWSGSMSNVLMDTLKQLYNLIWFCKKVGIPFRVYAFTLEFNRTEYDRDGKVISLKPHYEKREGLLCVDQQFSLMEFLSSDVSQSELEHQMKNIWRCAYAVKSWVSYTFPSKMSLSGTPLNESLIALHQIIPQFKTQYKLQKVQCVILTDGEANHIPCHKSVNRPWENNSYVGNRSLHPMKDYLRNRKTGTTYQIPYSWWDFTNILLKDLNDQFPSVNFIGIRVLDGRDAGHFIDRYCGQYGKDHDDAMKSWKKDRNFSIKVSGYSKYFGLSSSALAQESMFDVHECATKSQIKSAFVKSLKTKKLNKKILGEFVELIV